VLVNVTIGLCSGSDIKMVSVGYKVRVSWLLWIQDK